MTSLLCKGCHHVRFAYSGTSGSLFKNKRNSGEQENYLISFESRIQKSVPQDHCLSSCGKPSDAKRWSSGRIFLSYPHTPIQWTYASLLKFHPMVQMKAQGQLVLPSKKNIYASLVKIHPLVQKITHRNEFTQMLMLTESAPITIYPPPFDVWDIIIDIMDWRMCAGTHI